MKRETADELVARLGDLIGLPGLRLDRSGLCQLVLDGAWLVTLAFQPAGGRLLLHCPVSTPEAADALGVSALRDMLQANFMGGGGAMLAIGGDRRACVQCELSAPRPEAGELMDVLEMLLQAAQAWSARLMAAPSPPRSGAAFQRTRV